MGRTDVSFTKTSFTLMLVYASFCFSHNGAHEEEKPVLRVRRQDRNTLPKPPPRISDARRDTRSRFALGVYLAQDFGFSSNKDLQTPTPLSTSPTHNDGDGHKHIVACPPKSRCHAGEDHSVPDGSPTDAGSSSMPVLTVKSGYQVASFVSLVANLSTELSTGLRDPAAGLSFQFPIAHNFGGVASLLGSVPITKTSRDNGKITTISASLNNMYSDGTFFLGGGGLVGGSFYGEMKGENHSDSTSPHAAVHWHGETPHPTNDKESSVQASGHSPTSSRELVRTSWNTFMGYMLTQNFSGSVSGGVGTTYREDESFGWLTDVTIARLSYSYSGFMGAVAFSFLSDPKATDTLTMPDQPFLGIKLQYVFGRSSTLGIINTDNAHSSH